MSRPYAPAGWRASRLKFLATISAGGTPRVDDPCFWTDDAEGMAWAAIADMTREPALRSTARRVTPAGIRAARLPIGPPGTLLFAMYASVGAMARLEVPATWNQAIVGIAPRAGVSRQFLRYALQNSRPTFASLARSNTQDNLNQEQVGNLALLVPDGQRQKQIADFLDRECDRVSELLRKTREFEATTTEATLRTLRDAVGVDRNPWVQVRRVATPGTGHTPSRDRPEYWVPDECVHPWFTLADVWQLRDGRRLTVDTTTASISEAGLRNSSAVLHPAGTVLFSRTASVGFSAVMASEMAVSQDFMTWTCGPGLDPFFLLFALRATRPEIDALKAGSTHQTIYMPDLHALRIPLPSAAEQREAVSRIRASLASTAVLRDRLTAMTERLVEYRDALITEAVTGQLDVSQLSHAQLDESARAASEGEPSEVISA
jgi:type I restriction enzyme, S subunit